MTVFIFAGLKGNCWDGVTWCLWNQDIALDVL